MKNDEMFKNRHKTFKVTIGKPIPWQTFLVKHIKTAFVMKYLDDLPVPGHEHIYIGCTNSGS